MALLVDPLAFDPLLFVIWNKPGAKIGPVLSLRPLSFLKVRIPGEPHARDDKGGECRPFEISHGLPLNWPDVVFCNVNNAAALITMHLVPLGSLPKIKAFDGHFVINPRKFAPDGLVWLVLHQSLRFVCLYTVKLNWDKKQVIYRAFWNMKEKKQGETV